MCFRIENAARGTTPTLAAVLASAQLTHSVFWGAMAYTLIGGTLVGSILTPVFLPALYALWYRTKPREQNPPPLAALTT